MQEECTAKSARVIPAWLLEQSSSASASATMTGKRPLPRSRAQKIRENVAALTNVVVEKKSNDKEASKDFSGKKNSNDQTIENLNEILSEKKRKLEEVERDLENKKVQTRILEAEVAKRMKEERKMLDMLRSKDARIQDLIEKQAESDTMIASLQERVRDKEREENPDEEDTAWHPQHCPYSPVF
jgi:chromosome segregation ATPase